LTRSQFNVENQEKHLLFERHVQIVFNRLDSFGRSHIIDQETFANTPGVLMRKVVPADNSCLFTSVGYVLNGEQRLKIKKIRIYCNLLYNRIYSNNIYSNNFL